MMSYKYGKQENGIRHRKDSIEENEMHQDIADWDKTIGLYNLDKLNY